MTIHDLALKLSERVLPSMLKLEIQSIPEYKKYLDLLMFESKKLIGTEKEIAWAEKMGCRNIPHTLFNPNFCG